MILTITGDLSLIWSGVPEWTIIKMSRGTRAEGSGLGPKQYSTGDNGVEDPEMKITRYELDDPMKG